jgi:RNA polymerase sigma-70 factor (ECF subfamily)
LVARAREGDGAALERLLEAHQDQVYRTALGLMRGREDQAADVAQEVLISAFRHFSKFRGQSRFGTWLYRITVNLAKNRYVVENRERARYTSLEEQTRPDDDRKPRDFRDPGLDARDAAAGREQVALLLERLGQLEPEWREVIVLRFFEELSYEEIAESLNLPLGTVKSRINRARQALREIAQDLLEERKP